MSASRVFKPPLPAGGKGKRLHTSFSTTELESPAVCRHKHGHVYNPDRGGAAQTLTLLQHHRVRYRRFPYVQETIPSELTPPHALDPPPRATRAQQKQFAFGSKIIKPSSSKAGMSTAGAGMPTRGRTTGVGAVAADAGNAAARSRR